MIQALSVAQFWSQFIAQFWSQLVAQLKAQFVVPLFDLNYQGVRQAWVTCELVRLF